MRIDRRHGHAQRLPAHRPGFNPLLFGSRTMSTLLLWKEIGVSALALTLAAWAGFLDWRSRRIPNWLTVPSLGLGLVISTLAWGWPGTKAALEGAGLALGFLLPFVLARGLGAGDWKLMGALGAFLGPSRTLLVLFGTILIAGLMSVIEMIRQRRVKQTLENTLTLIHAWITFRVRPAKHGLTLDSPGMMAVPFGVAAAFSTVLFFCIQSAMALRLF
jgi:prepilin peptidase CpaA